MPELPEVETLRRQLAPLVTGRRIARAEIRDGRLTRPLDPGAVAAQLEGERITTLDRRGKYLIFRFESGRSLLIHLRMTGSLRHVPRETSVDDRHGRAVVRLDDASDVVYRDVRRFGTWVVLEPGELDAYLAARLGAEPLERRFRSRVLGERLAGRRAPVKALLLTQTVLAGVGNIYADEALWRARIHPLTAGGELTDEEVRALHRAVRRALAAGIERQGATLRDYARPDGSSGSMQHEFKVYGRDGEPCSRCGTPIEKIRAAGRGTWYCPGCQRAKGGVAQRARAELGETTQAASRSSSWPERSSRQSSA